MRKHPSLRSRQYGAETGFVLVAVLLAITLLLIVIVVFSNMVKVETTNSGNAEYNGRARQNAIAAMNLALGELQKQMGPDQRISAPASLLSGALGNGAYTNNPYWTGVWNSTNFDQIHVPDYTAGKTNVFREWLVSCPTNAAGVSAPTAVALPAAALAISTNTVALVSTGSCGVTNQVVVWKIAGDTQGAAGIENKYAWWVGDEGVKARINLPAATTTNLGQDLSALLGAPGANPLSTTNFPGVAASSITNENALLQAAATYDSLALAYKSSVPLTNNFFDFTPYSQGVLANVQQGGLKQDLNLLLEQSSAFAVNAATAGATATDFPQAAPLPADPVYHLGTNTGVPPTAINNNANSPSNSGYPWLYAYNTGTYLGTDWGYLYRYYNIYKKVFRSPTDGAFTLNVDNYNVGTGDTATLDPIYTAGSNSSSPSLDSGGPYNNNQVSGVGGITYQWSNGKYPGRADFIVPLMLRLQTVFGLYQGSLDFTDVGQQGATGTKPWPTANPTIYYMAYFPVMHLWNPYNIRIKTQTKKGSTTGFIWHTADPPVSVNLDGTAAKGSTVGWEQLVYSDSTHSGTSIFWDSSGQFGDLITGYGSNYQSTPITLEPGAVALYATYPKSMGGNGGALYSGDGTLSASNQPSSQTPYNITSSSLSNTQSTARTYNLATTTPGWPTSPLCPFVSYSLGVAMSPSSNCYSNAAPTTDTKPTTYTYQDWIPTANFPTLQVQVQFDFSKIAASKYVLGTSLLGGQYSKTNLTDSGASTGNYEINFPAGSASTPDPTSYPPLPPASTAAITVKSTSVPSFPDTTNFVNGVNIQPLYLFMVELDRRVYPFDVQGGTRFALFSDPLTHAYLLGGGGAQPYQLSPYEYTLKYLSSNALGAPIINDPAPGATDNGIDAIYGGAGGQSGFGANGAVLYNVAAELPVAPLLSLAQIQNVPLGRDYGNPENAVEDGNNGIAGSGNYLGKQTPVTYAATFNHAFGNSYAHPMIPANALSNASGGDGRSFDHSFYANNALWDGYFFSGIAPQDSAAFSSYGGSAANPLTAYSVLSNFIAGTSLLPDPRYQLYIPAGHVASEIQGVLLPNATSAAFSSLNTEGVCKGDVYSGTTPQAITGTTVTPYSQTAMYLMNQGAFNVNSVSVPAWTALLSGLQNPLLSALNVAYTKTTSSTSSAVVTSGTSSFFPFLRFMLPNNTGIQTSGGTAQNYWNGYHELTSTQIQTLAGNIVAEVKERGPFLSLAEFVNRQVSGNAKLNGEGALQAAIDGPDANANASDSALTSPGINTLSDPTPAAGSATDLNAKANVGSRYAGTPAYLTQADLLTPLANVLSARSDTFIIRSYGEVNVGGKIVSRAYCEAVVQRVPDFVVNRTATVTTGDAPTAWPPTNPLNLQFGRKFKVIQFRWLSPDQI